MPVITMLSPKGGAGKSTMINIIATTFAGEGASVCIIDCDNSQQTTSKWYRGPKHVKEDSILTRVPLTLIRNVDQDEFYNIVGNARREFQFVFIDTAGSADLINSRAIISADLVVIPCKPSPADMDEALKAISLIRHEAQGRGKPIKHVVVMTEVPADNSFKTRIQKEFEASLEAEGVKLLGPQLVKREAYKHIFYERVSLTELDPKKVSKLDLAIKNAGQVSLAVFEQLKAEEIEAKSSGTDDDVNITKENV